MEENIAAAELVVVGVVAKPEQLVACQPEREADQLVVKAEPSTCFERRIPSCRFLQLYCKCLASESLEKWGDHLEATWSKVASEDSQ